MGDVVFAVLLVLAVAVIVLDTARNRRPGASLPQVLVEVAGRPTDWQLVVCGLGFVAAAFASVLTPWAGLVGLPVAVFLVRFLHASRPRRPAPALPRQREVLATPEPASNMRLL